MVIDDFIAALERNACIRRFGTYRTRIEKKPSIAERPCCKRPISKSSAMFWDGARSLREGGNSVCEAVRLTRFPRHKEEW